MRGGRRGLALLVVVGVLGVMSVLATAFVMMAQLERRACQQRVHTTKAFLLAKSGIEDGLARLVAGQDPYDPVQRYAGENWDGSADGRLSDLEAVEQAYRVTPPGTPADLDACPLRHAMRPSFFARGVNARPDLLRTDGRMRGYSGRLAGDLRAAGNCFVLRARGEDGIYVNGGDLTSAGVHAGTHDESLEMILGSLGRILSGSGVEEWASLQLVKDRPAGGWRSMAHIREVLGWTRVMADAIAPYLCFHAWTDRKVVRPSTRAFPPEVELGSIRGTQAEAATGVGDDPSQTTEMRLWNPLTRSYAPDFERAQSSGDANGDGVPDPSQRILGRAPVNLAWAREKHEVLWSLLEPVIDWREAHTAANAFQALGPGTTYTDYPNWDGTWTIDSWEEFNHFVDEKCLEVYVHRMDLMKALFNPNTDTNKGNPCLSFHRAKDKVDLAGTTEFAFDNPLKRLESLGRVTDAQGRILAERSLSCVVEVWRQFRITAQSEFCAGDGGLGDLDVAGDESRFRFPGDLAFPGASISELFLSASNGVDKTSGSKMGPFSTSWQGLTNARNGVSLQSYPEPQWPTPVTLFGYETPCPTPAVWDGNLQLATVDTGYAGSMTFLASWEMGCQAELARGSPQLAFAEAAEVMDPDVKHPAAVSSSILGGALHSSVVNPIRPDGIYSENNRTPAYLAAGNIPPMRGCVSFWVKPSGPTTVGASYGAHLYLNLTRIPDASIREPNGDPLSQAFLLANGAIQHGGNETPDPAGVPGATHFAALAENACTIGDDKHEHLEGTLAGRVPTQDGNLRQGGAHQWFLLTYQWNLQSSDLAGFHRLTVDGQRIWFSQYLSDYTNDGSTAEDLTGDSIPCCDYIAMAAGGPPGPHHLFLGSTWTSADLCTRGIARPGYWLRSADATLDEFAVYDLGTDMAQGSILAENRFRTGRYYKESDAKWTSALIQLPAGSRVVGLDWTLILPTYDPGDPNDPNRAFYGTGADVYAGRTADALLEVCDASGSLVRYASSRAGLRRNRTAIPFPDGRMRLSATLRPSLEDNAAPFDKMNAPLLESPVLDDITVCWLPPGGPRVLEWLGE